MTEFGFPTDSRACAKLGSLCCSSTNSGKHGMLVSVSLTMLGSGYSLGRYGLDSCSIGSS